MANFTKFWFDTHIPNFQRFLKPEIEILEIGSYEGRSTLWMLQNLKPKRMLCIDPGYLDGNKTLKENLKGYNYELIEATNLHACQFYLFDKFDFVYVDGSHSEKNCYFDLIIGLTVLRRGGILAADDYGKLEYSPDGTRAKEAIDRFMKEFNLEILHLEYQAWFKK